MKSLLKRIAAFAVTFGLTCIFLFAFIHWAIIGQALNEIPWQRVVLQGCIIGGMTGAGLGLMVYFKHRE